MSTAPPTGGPTPAYPSLRDRGWRVAGVCLAITTALWAIARFSGEPPPDFLPWLALSQLTILWSATLMSIAMVAVVRARALEPLFGGLDSAVRFHRIVGPSAVVLLVIHVLLLALHARQRGVSIGEIFIPFWSPSARSIDILVFYAILLLAGLAYDRRMSYERWLTVHPFLGPILLAGTVHASIEPGTIRDFEPLRTWMVVLLLAGGAAWLYRVLLFDRLGPRYAYGLEKAEVLGSNIVELVMRPIDRRMMYEPGTFAFVRLPGLEGAERELHPFSITSSPIDRDLRFSIRMVGDFTRRLETLDAGALVDVYGPFGGFTPHRFARFRRLVLVGAGIGITPFLGMLAFERSNRDFRRIWLYYVVRDEKDAVYDAEIRDSHLDAESYIDYELWITGRQGRISAAAIAAEVAPLDDYAVMLCGNMAFAQDLASQFRALNIPSDRIITEELQFR